VKKIKIIEIKSEIGAGTRGASLGIDAIKIAAYKKGSHFFNQFPCVEIPTENHLLFEFEPSPLYQYAKNINGVVRMYEKISEMVMDMLAKNFFPLILAGDHSNAGGTIAGIKMAYPDKTLGLIWIDAHSDIHSPYTTPSGNMNGMPLAAALNEDNLACLVNKPHERTIKLWNRLKETGDIAPKLNYNMIVFVAVREFEKPEQYLMEKHHIKRHTTNAVRQKGGKKVAEQANFSPFGWM